MLFKALGEGLPYSLLIGKVIALNQDRPGHASGRERRSVAVSLCRTELEGMGVRTANLTVHFVCCPGSGAAQEDKTGLEAWEMKDEVTANCSHGVSCDPSSLW